MNKELIDLFVQAVKISSPSGEEKKMCNWVKRRLDSSGWQTWVDNAGKLNNSNSGNLYAYLELDKSSMTTVFVAHLDTVQIKTDMINPIKTGNIITSDKKTILGADNKAGIVSLLYAATNLNKDRLGKNVLFFFPTREESGVMGSSFFKFTRSEIDYVFNVDNSDKPGVFVDKALGYLNFKILVKGRASHAAQSYNSGIDAVKAAGKYISKVDVGVDRQRGWTMNLGIIKGGTSTNVVCDHVEIHGELRAFSNETFDLKINDLNQIADKVTQETGARIGVQVDKSSFIPPLDKQNSLIQKRCVEVCKELNIKPKFLTSYSTSDANWFGEKYQVISISRGGMNPHSVEEVLDISDLELCTELVQSLIYT